MNTEDTRNECYVVCMAEHASELACEEAYDLTNYGDHWERGFAEVEQSAELFLRGRELRLVVTVEARVPDREAWCAWPQSVRVAFGKDADLFGEVRGNRGSIHVEEAASLAYRKCLDAIFVRHPDWRALAEAAELAESSAEPSPQTRGARRL